MKTNLIAALHELPPDLQSLADVKFGSISTVEIPTTVDDAIKVQGVVAANFNNAILAPLSGLPIVQLGLHIGQNAPALHGVLLSALQVAASLAKEGAFTLSAEDGASFAVGAIPMAVTINSGSVSAVSGTLEGPDVVDFDFDGGGKQWNASPEVAKAGGYTLTVTVSFVDNDAQTQSVDITVTASEEGGE